MAVAEQGMNPAIHSDSGKVREFMYLIAFERTVR